MKEFPMTKSYAKWLAWAEKVALTRPPAQRYPQKKKRRAKVKPRK
jgi:hypothetical protein